MSVVLCYQMMTCVPIGGANVHDGCDICENGTQYVTTTMSLCVPFSQMSHIHHSPSQQNLPSVYHKTETGGCWEPANTHTRLTGGRIRMRLPENLKRISWRDAWHELLMLYSYCFRGNIPTFLCNEFTLMPVLTAAMRTWNFELRPKIGQLMSSLQ